MSSFFTLYCSYKPHATLFMVPPVKLKKCVCHIIVLFQRHQNVVHKGIHSDFKRQPQKMVKHTQTIRQLSPTNCLSMFDLFVGLVVKGLKNVYYV